MKETIRVQGMSCSHCVAAVTKAVASLKGVSSVDVSLENKQAVVEFDAQAVSLNEIRSAIEDQGYDVE